MAKLAELLHSRPGGIEVERSAEPMDDALACAARERAAGEIERHTQLVHAIDAALARLDAHEYGICEDCGEPIPVKRLMAVAWATRCVQCQEKEER